jgi:drug/metabolite transporter (DMT)-like permease
MMDHPKHAKWMMIGSMAVFGTIGLFVRYIPLTSGEISLWRSVLAALMIGGYLLISRQKIDRRALRKQLPLLLASGFALGLNWVFLFEAYRYTTVSVATLCCYFAPVLVTIACPILFHEKISRKQWLCFGMSTLGLIFIMGFGGEGGNRHVIGVLCGLGSAVLYASVILINKFMHGVDDIPRTFLQFVASVLVMAPYTLLTGYRGLATLDGIGWGHLLFLGLFHTGFIYCIYFYAIRKLPGQKTAILSYIDPLVAILLSLFLLGEGMSLWQIIGGSLILGFTFWNELSDK